LLTEILNGVLVGPRLVMLQSMGEDERELEQS
jgi:hypothetical protein